MIRLGAVLHDVGKIGIPDAILLKPGALTDAERRRMQEHAGIGHKLLSGSGSSLLDLASQIAWTHHERFDGKGYPAGSPATRPGSRAGSPQWRTCSTPSPTIASTARRSPSATPSG